MFFSVSSQIPENSKFLGQYHLQIKDEKHDFLLMRYHITRPSKEGNKKTEEELFLLNRQASLRTELLIESEAEKELEIEIVRELKESLSSWLDLGIYFENMDSSIVLKELNELKESALKDQLEALKIIQLINTRPFEDKPELEKRGEQLAIRLLEYYPRTIGQKKELLAKSNLRRKRVNRLLSEDILDLLSLSTEMEDEASLLEEVLKELVEKLEDQTPGSVLEMCYLLEEVEWGTESVTTLNVDGFDSIYDFFMSIFERAEGYDFYTGSWTGNRRQTVDEANSTIEDIARKARQALIKLLEDSEKNHKLGDEYDGR